MMKFLFDYTLAIIVIFLAWPLMGVIAILIKITSSGPILFKQKRVGKNGRIFTIYKYRTMYQGAEKDQKKYLKENEADDPVFKLHNDPRFVGIGKYLAKSGLDELPQVFNILKGEMSWVGPRPLPVDEARRLAKWQKKREEILPGITSAWVVNGKHKLGFSDWMRLDIRYINEYSLLYDLKVLLKTLFLILANLK